MSLENIIQDITKIKQEVEEKQRSFYEITRRVKERHNNISYLLGTNYSAEIGQCFQIIVQNLESSEKAIGQKANELENYATHLSNLTT